MRGLSAREEEMRLIEENIINRLEEVIKRYEYGNIITPSEIETAIELIKELVYERDTLVEHVERIEALEDMKQ